MPVNLTTPSLKENDQTLPEYEELLAHALKHNAMRQALTEQLRAAQLGVATEIAHKIAEADLISAEAQFTEAKFNMEYSEIRAPFDGRILNLAIQLGQTIINTHMATPMLSMASDSTMLARVETTFEDLARLRPDSEVEIQIHNNRYQGRVIGSTPHSPIRCDEETSSPSFLVSFQPDGERLYQGMPAQVTTPH